MNATITTDNKENVTITSGSTTYTIKVDQYGILRIHGEYQKADGTLEENAAIAMSCVDRTTAEVYLT